MAYDFSHANLRKGCVGRIRPSKDDITFCLTTASYEFVDNETRIVAYGVLDDERGTPINVNIGGFKPHFKIKLPIGYDYYKIEALQHHLNNKLRWKIKSSLEWQCKQLEKLQNKDHTKTFSPKQLKLKRKKLEELKGICEKINFVVQSDIDSLKKIIQKRTNDYSRFSKSAKKKSTFSSVEKEEAEDENKKALKELEERGIDLIYQKSKEDKQKLEDEIHQLEEDLSENATIKEIKTKIKIQSAIGRINEWKKLSEYTSYTKDDPRGFITSVEIVEGRDLDYWAEEGTKYKFIQFNLIHPKLVKLCINFLEKPDYYFKGKGLEYLVPDIEEGDNQHFQIYEADCDFIIRWLVDTHSIPSSWFKIEKGTYDVIQPREQNSTCEREIYTHYTNVKMETSKEYMDRVPNYVELVFDIEVVTNGKHFPRSDQDAICCIVASVSRIEDEVPVYHCFSVGTTEKVMKGIDYTYHFDNDKDLIESFYEFWHTVHPDVIGHHNGNNFDIPYIIRRGILHGFDNYTFLGRSKTNPIYKHKQTTKGKKKTFVALSGIVNIDLLRRAEDDFNNDDNTLAGLSYKLLDKQTKNEMPYDMIEECTKTEKGRTTLAVYCAKDVYLTFLLLRKIQALLGFFEISKIAMIPIEVAMNRSEGAKVEGRLRQECYRQPIPLFKRTMLKTQSTGYAGAKVLDPIPGYYLGQIIITLDFSSMYPNIIQEKNLCYTTLLRESDIIKYRFKAGIDYWRLPDTIDDGTCVKTVENPENPAFMIEQKIGGLNEDGTAKLRYEGLLPKIEKELGILRKAVRKKHDSLELNELSKLTKGTQAYTSLNITIKLLDQRQLAIKRWMNAIYGLTGDPTSKYFQKKIAFSVTTVGRFMILTVKYEVEKQFCKKNGWYFDTQIIYGDSVTGDTPILCKSENVEFYRNIEDIVPNGWTNYHGNKECINLEEGLQVWTETGWTNVIRIIRHKNGKNIKRVLTHTGVVDVTTDHSLLKPNGEKIKPTEIEIGSPLLHANLPNDNEYFHYGLTKDQAYAWGMFYAEGYCGAYHYEKCGWKYSWVISNQDTSLFARCIKGLEESETNKFKTYDTLKSSGAYKLCATGDIKSLVLKFRALFYDSRAQKKVPDEIINSPLEIQKAFMDGYYDGDGDQDPNGYYRFDNKGKIGAAGLYLLCQRLGYSISINIRADKPDIYRLTCTKEKQRHNPITVKKIVDLGVIEGYVYDLETENHHFSAGIGKLIVHNTDSVFVWLKGFTENGGTVPESFSIGIMMAAWITKNFFKYPANLTFEKIYRNLVMCEEKKNYFGWKFECGYEIGKLKPYVEKKGLAMKKRGPTQYMKDTCVKSLHNLCVLGDAEKAFKEAQDRFKALENGQYEMYELIEKRGLAKDPDDYKEREEVFINNGDGDEMDALMRDAKVPYFLRQEASDEEESDDEDPKLQSGSMEEMDLLKISKKYFPDNSDVVKIIKKLGDRAKNAKRPITKFTKKGIHPAG